MCHEFYLKNDKYQLFSPAIKLQILLTELHTFLLRMVGRNCHTI